MKAIVISRQFTKPLAGVAYPQGLHGLKRAMHSIAKPNGSNAGA